MANAGNHFDTVLLKRMIIEGKIITISPEDHPVILRIKQRFNKIVVDDDVTNEHYFGKKYLRHSAWDHMTSTSIWINQLRFKHWIFEPLAGKLVKPTLS